MNKKIVIVLTVLIASTLGVSFGISAGQVSPPASFVGTPPKPLSTDEVQAINLAAMYGSTTGFIENVKITGHDLDVMNISRPNWANGEPASMRLVVTSGSYSVPILTNDGISKQMTGTVVLQVIDEAVKIPTVTIVTSGAEADALLGRLMAWQASR